jgi:O-antigen ligase
MNKVNIFIGYIILAFPVFMITGSLLTNLFSIVLSLYALLNYKSLKNLILSKNKFFLIIFSFFLFIFPYHSINFENSILKFLFYFRQVFMFFGIIIYLMNNNLNNKILDKIKNIYLIILSIIIIDIIIEYFTGSNIFGNKATYTGRISSFTNDELIIGYIFCFLTLFSYGLIVSKIKNIYFIIFVFFALLISFIIGERSNFIKLFLLLLLFSSFHNLRIKKFSLVKLSKIILIIFSLIILFFVITKNTSQANKLYKTPINILNSNEINLDIKENFYKSKHAAHYLTAINIFSSNPLFGIGIDNFKEESRKDKYYNKKLTFSEERSSSHPHQLYFELLAEVGLFGFIYFLIIFIWSLQASIKSYFMSNNPELLGHIMLYIFFIFPILPSGSFFGTTYGLPFWFNFAILIYLINKEFLKLIIKK